MPCKRFRCSRCGSRPHTLRENVAAHSSWIWDSESGTYIYCSWDAVPTAEIDAICDCGHMWRIRNFRYVPEVNADASDRIRATGSSDQLGLKPGKGSLVPDIDAEGT